MEFFEDADLHDKQIEELECTYGFVVAQMALGCEKFQELVQASPINSVIS